MSELEQYVSIEDMPPGFTPGGFDCGEQELTDYLCDGSAELDQEAGYSKTYLILDSRNRSLIGYFSILADAIRLQTKERPAGITYASAPAIKLGRMGIDQRYRGNQLGELVLLYVIGLARRFALQAGVRYVTLDALQRPKLVAWYERNGFVKNEGEKKGQKIIRQFHRAVGMEVELEHVSMRFDILRESETPLALRSNVTS